MGRLVRGGMGGREVPGPCVSHLLARDSVCKLRTQDPAELG